MINRKQKFNSWNIFFDPNTEPSYFYPKIKPLSLIADCIYLFSPHVLNLEMTKKMTPEEFLTLYKKTDFLRPVISTEWNDPQKRKNHPHKAFRNFTSFDKTLYKDEKKFYRLVVT